MDISPRYTGSEWQIWADQLLQRHYGPGGYQKVPDKDQGDAGIEGFTIDKGHAYQAYGPEEPLTTTERYKKHSAKITRDINKFINNRSILKDIFGHVVITKWILLVPFYDSKKIVTHASKKTQEVLAANLPYVSKDFRVVIEDENAFSVERNILLSNSFGQIAVRPKEAEEQLGSWSKDNNNLVMKIDDKASRLPTLISDDAQLNFRNQIIKRYLEGQNLLEEIRKYPTTYETITRIKSEKERHLEMEMLLSTKGNNRLLIDTLDTIKKAIELESSNIVSSTIEGIAWECISDWIIRCPLDFK